MRFSREILRNVQYTYSNLDNGRRSISSPPPSLANRDFYSFSFLLKNSQRNNRNGEKTTLAKQLHFWSIQILITIAKKNKLGSMFGNEIIVGEVWWQNRWEIFAGNFSFCSPFIEYFYLWGVSMANRKTFKTREFSVEMRIYWCMVIQFGRVLCFFLD